jgi:gamma-glutamylcyclotransferase (GGCT)/AIG2-like uncharacterized protein YtfP
MYIFAYDIASVASQDIPPYTYLLKPVKVYTEKGVYNAYAFMYNSNEGMTKLDSGKWTE